MTVTVPQVRIAFRVATAVVHLRVAAMQPSSADASVATAVELHHRRRARGAGHAPTCRCSGSFGLGVAELAAHRGDAELARELWAAGVRLGANLVMLFQLGIERTAGRRPRRRGRPRAPAGPVARAVVGRPRPTGSGS